MEKVAKLAREIRDAAAEADDFQVQGTFEAISPDLPRICGSFARCAPMRMQGEACDAKAEEKDSGRQALLPQKGLIKTLSLGAAIGMEQSIRP